MYVALAKDNSTLLFVVLCDPDCGALPFLGIVTDIMTNQQMEIKM